MSEQNEISMSDFFSAEPPQDSSSPLSESEGPKVKICKVCSLDLGPLELQARLSYHFDCCNCEHCGNEIAKEIMMRWILDKGPRAHSTCHETYMAEEISKRPIEITQGMLDYLNSWRLCPDMTRTIEENQSRASIATRKNAVDMNHDELYVFMKMMQAVSGTISVIVSENKQSNEIKLRREAFDKEREKRSKDLVEDAQEYRVSQQALVEKKKTKKLLTKQTPEGKLLNQFLVMGMSLEQAKQMLGNAKQKADENIQ